GPERRGPPSERGEHRAERGGEAHLRLGRDHLRPDAHRHDLRHELRHAGAALGPRLSVRDRPHGHRQRRALADLPVARLALGGKAPHRARTSFAISQEMIRPVPSTSFEISGAETTAGSTPSRRRTSGSAEATVADQTQIEIRVSATTKAMSFETCRTYAC